MLLPLSWHAAERLLKILVRLQRPFVDGPFVDWSGYNFASGHTIGTTLLYGQLLLFILAALKARQRRRLMHFSAISLVILVGFSRIALGAHFLTGVLAAIFFGMVWLALCTALCKPLAPKGWHSPAPLPLADCADAVFVPAESAPQPLGISKAA